MIQTFKKLFTPFVVTVENFLPLGSSNNVLISEYFFFSKIIYLFVYISSSHQGEILTYWGLKVIRFEVVLLSFCPWEDKEFFGAS